MNEQWSQPDLTGMIEPVGISWGDANALANKIYLAPGYRLLAAAIIASHARARDYLEQCPAILTMLAGKSIPRSADHYALLSRQLGWRLDNSPKLKDLLRHFELTKPMRKISGKVLGPSRYWAIKMIGQCDPRVVASSIPEKSWWQRAWLTGCLDYHDALANRSHLALPNVASSRVEWFIFAMSQRVLKCSGDEIKRFPFGPNIITLRDFIIAREVRTGEIPFDEKWTFEQALAAAERWHAIINAAAIERDFKQHYDLDIDHVWKMTPWPDDAVSVNGFTFLPLNSGRLVSNQATEMHNCLRTYLPRIVKGQYRAWAVADPKANPSIVATMGMTRIVPKHGNRSPLPPRNEWRIDQIEGRRHSRTAHPDIHAACKQFYRTAF